MSKQITGIVGWLKNWFYDESEIDGFITTLNNSIGSKLNANLTEANKNLVTNGSGTVVLEDKPVIPDVSGKADKTGGVQQVTDSNAHSNIGTSANATQGAINTAIDSVIGSLSSIRAIEVVSTLPTASASTLGKLYIISENSKVNVYYTQQSGSSYSWHKMDTDILDDIVVNWSDVQGRPTKTSDFINDGDDGYDTYVVHDELSTVATSGDYSDLDNIPSTFTPSSHTHGNLTNDGKIGNTANKVIITGTGGSLTAVSTIGATNVADVNAHNNIGSSASATQGAINTAIDTKIGTLQGGVITSIVLVDKATDSTGKIIFYTGDEPT